MVMRARAAGLLLLSSRPEAHMPLLAALRRNNVPTLVAREAPRAARLLDRAPALVLVDLAHGADLTPEIVRRLNRLDGRGVVLALHAGELRACARIEELSVRGFCDVRRWRDLVGIASAHAAPASTAVH